MGLQSGTGLPPGNMRGQLRD